MFIFVILRQKFDFDRSHFGRMGATLTEFYFFKLRSLLVLAESCFKAPKVSLDEYFYNSYLKNAKDEHFNGKIIHLTELLKQLFLNTWNRNN